MGKFVLRVSIAVALGISFLAILTLLSRDLDGYALVWGVLALGLIYEWGQI